MADASKDVHESVGTDPFHNTEGPGIAANPPEDTIQAREVPPERQGNPFRRLVKVLPILLIAAIAGTWWYVRSHKSESEARAQVVELGAFVAPGAVDKPAHTINLSLVQGKANLDAIVRLLPEFGKLKNIDARGTPLDDEHLKRIGQLDTLIGLTLTETKVTDQGMAHLTGLDRLINLTLYSTQVGNRGLAEIAKLKSVKILNIGDTRVSGDLAEIAGMENLEWLIANGLTLADEAATTLANLENLSHLTIEGTQISEEAVQAILKEKPGLGLDR